MIKIRVNKTSTCLFLNPDVGTSCESNIILTTDDVVLTSGYRSGQDKLKPFSTDSQIISSPYFVLYHPYL